MQIIPSKISVLNNEKKHYASSNIVQTKSSNVCTSFNNTKIASENYRAMFAHSLKVSFKGEKKEAGYDFEKFNKALEYAMTRSEYLKSFSREIQIKDFDIEKLEGIQQGLPLFRGMTMKEIAFLAQNLHQINLHRGCTNGCSHCLADAKPPIPAKSLPPDYINNMSWEDFNTITENFEALNALLGFSIAESDIKNRDSVSPFYDADCMETVLTDKNGKEHDMTEIIPKLSNALNRTILFDTSGWSPKNKKMQERAEKYVQFFSNEENHKYIKCFNVSLNPFHGLNTKYAEYIKSDPEKAKKFRELYTDRMANVFYTLSPLIGRDKFTVLNRCAPNISTADKEYKEDSFKNLIKEIREKLENKYIEDKNKKRTFLEKMLGKNKNKPKPDFIREKYDLEQHMRRFDFETKRIYKNTYAVGRMEKLLKTSDPLKVNAKYVHGENRTNPVKNLRDREFMTMIDANGKVYFSDIFDTFKTELQLNIDNKDKKTVPIKPNLAEYVITKKDIENIPFSLLVE